MKANGPKNFWNIDKDFDPLMYVCLPPDIDCGAAVYQPTAVELSNFFDGQHYIPNSFENKYNLATNIFGQVLVDHVID